MAGIIKASINLNAIDKSKIIEGKKGKYLPITITVNDEPDQFGNQGPVQSTPVSNNAHHLGPPGPSTSQILGTFSRFSETFLAEREGGSPGDPPGP